MILLNSLINYGINKMVPSGSKANPKTTNMEAIRNGEVDLLNRSKTVFFHRRKSNQFYLPSTKFICMSKDKNYLHCCQLFTIYKVVK